VEKASVFAQPYVDKARVHVDPALESASKGYSTAAKALEEHVPKLKQKSALAISQVSDAASSAPGHLNKVLDPAFGAFSTAFPQHRSILPEDPVDRLLVLIVFLFFVYNFFFIARFFLRIALRIASLVLRIAIGLGIKVPFKLTTSAMSWGFFFGTGFYVCGLCRRRKNAKGNSVPAEADAKAEPKKKAAATVAELVTMLKKAEEKGKLDDGVARLASACKNNKELQVEGSKGKVVQKDELKKALAKFPKVDVKKLSL
jgi:hypothetical protein